MQPLGRDVQLDAAVAVGDRQPGLRPEEGLVLDADLVAAADDDLAAGASGSPRRIGTLRRRCRPGAAPGASSARAALHGDQRLQRLVVDGHQRGGAAGGRRIVGGDDRHRLAVVAHAVDREHRLVGDDAADELVRPGTSSWVSTARTPGSARAARVSIARISAEAYGLRTVAPQSMPVGVQVRGVQELRRRPWRGRRCAAGARRRRRARSSRVTRPLRIRALSRRRSAASVSGSAVRSSPSSTTTSPPTSSVSTGRVGPKTSAATGSSMPAKPTSSRSQSATSASAPTLKCPNSSSRPRQRAPWRVAISSAWRAVSARGPAVAAGEQHRGAQLVDQLPALVGRRAVDAEADRRAGGQQRRGPARCPRRAGRWRSGSARRRCRSRPSARVSASLRWTQCASQTSSPSQPKSSRYCSGRTPKRSRQKRSSSSVSARWVCSRTPRARASSAVSAISSSVTLNGEVGASAIRTRAPGAGSWWRSIATAQASRIASRSSTTSSGGSPPCADAEVHRAAAGMEAQPDRARGVDLDGQQVALAAGEDVVVVGRWSCSPSARATQAPARAAASTTAASMCCQTG